MRFENADKIYYRLSGRIYNIDKSTNEVNIDLEQSNQIFKALESRIDHENGFKAMAVTPVKGDGSWDKDETYFAFAGTSPFEDDSVDIGEDIHLVAANVLPEQQINYPVAVQISMIIWMRYLKPEIMIFITTMILIVSKQSLEILNNSLKK